MYHETHHNYNLFLGFAGFTETEMKTNK